MTSSRYFEDNIMFSTGCCSLFSDKTYTTVVFISLRMSAFILGLRFSSFINFSFVFNKKFQHVQMIDFYPCCLFLLKSALIIMIMLAQIFLSRSNYSKQLRSEKKSTSVFLYTFTCLFYFQFSL